MHTAWLLIVFYFQIFRLYHFQINYSDLNASIGLIFTALCAGIIPIINPKTTMTAIAANTFP